MNFNFETSLISNLLKNYIWKMSLKKVALHKSNIRKKNMKKALEFCKKKTTT